MAGISKGKKRLTLELRPDTLDELDAFSNEIGKSRGAIIDELVAAFVKCDPRVATELCIECQKRSIRTLDEARGTSSGLERQSLEAVANSYRSLSSQFRLLSGSNELSPGSIEYAIVPLAVDGREVVPSSMTLINPADTLSCEYLYMSWFMSPDHPCDQTQAWNGESPGGLFGFASTRNDLYKYGQAQARFKSRDEQRSCALEARVLIDFMLRQARRVFELDTGLNSLQFAWTDIANAFESTSEIGLSAKIMR